MGKVRKEAHVREPATVNAIVSEMGFVEWLIG